MAFPEKATAFVTGGGSGLGRAIATELARRGARVAVADVDAAGADATIAELRSAGADAIAVPCDVSKLSDFESAIARAEERFGPVDILVNNAGVAVAGPVGTVPIEDWNWIIGINLLGVVHGCHLMLPRFKAVGRGYILNVASAAGLVSTKEMGPYNATKAGVVALSETIYQEGAPFGVHVTVLCPTFFKTNIIARGRSHGPKQLENAALALMARSRLQAPDVAKHALDTLERGELYAVPMADGRWMWRMKRFSPAFYYRALLPRAQRWIASKLGEQRST